MASLNITIDSTAAVAGASRIEHAIDRIATSAATASSAISTLERSSHKNLGVLNQSFKTSTSQLKEFDTALNKINPNMLTLASGFTAVNRGATSAIGSITKFFGQIAIGVFLVGELVMIFSALVRGIAALSKSMSSVEMSQITYQFAVLKDQIKSIVSDVFDKFSKGFVESFEGLNKWIAQNRQDIVNFITDSIESIKSFFSTVKEIYDFAEANPLIKDAGIIGLILLGVSGKSIIGKIGALVATLSVLSDIYKSVKLISQDKMSVSEFLKGMLDSDMATLSNSIAKRQLEDKKVSGALTPREEIKLAKIELNGYIKDRDELMVAKDLAPRNIEIIRSLHNVNNKIQEQTEYIERLQKALDGIDYSGLNPLTSPEFIKAQKDIFKETKIATTDYLAWQTREQEKVMATMIGSEFFPGIFSGTENASENYSAADTLKLYQQLEIWQTKNARSLMIYNDQFKETKLMAKDHYNLLVAQENLYHATRMSGLKSESEKFAENARYESALYKLRVQALIEQDAIQKRQWTMQSTSGVIWTSDSKREDILPQLFENHEDVLKVAQGISAVDEALAKMLISFDMADPALKRDGIIVALFGDADNVINNLQKINNEINQFDFSAMYDAQDKETMGEYYKIFEDMIEGFDSFQKVYTQMTGKVTDEWYINQTNGLELMRKRLDDIGIVGKEANEILEKLARQKDIKWFESQDSLEAGFLAGLLRLKDEIEPWGKTMSDAVVNAAHDMYNAMDDFFFNALEGRMKSFEEYFGGFMSAIHQAMAGFLTENIKRGIAELFPEIAPTGDKNTSTGGFDFSSIYGSMYKRPSQGGGGYQIAMPNAEYWGGESTKSSSMSTGQYAAGAMIAGATIYDIYQRSSGTSKPAAAAGGAMAGAASGAAMGYYMSSYSGPYAAIGAAVGAIVGGISGYLGGADAPEKAKFRLGAGKNVNTKYPNVETPFGQFGFDQAAVIDTNRFKSVMAQVGVATESIADIMDSASIEKITTAMAGWRSGSARGDIEAAEFEEQFINYFKEIGSEWSTGLGDWMTNFDGTFDDLMEGIDSHVKALKAIDEVFDPTTEYESTIDSISDSFDDYIKALKDTGGTVEEIARGQEAKNKALADANKKFRDEVVDIGMNILDFMGMLDPLDAAMYNIDQMFIDWIDRLVEIGATETEIDFVKNLIPRAKETAAEDLRDAQATTIADINMSTGEMIGIFSELDVTIYNLTAQFLGWWNQVKDFDNAAEYATILTERWTIAIDKAAKALDSAYYSALASLPGLSKAQSGSFATSAIAVKYGLEGSDITGSMVSNLYNLASSGDYSSEDVRGYLDSIGAAGIGVAEFVNDIGTLHEIFFPMQESVTGTTDALDRMRNELESTIKSIQGAISGIDDLIWELTGGQYAPVQSLEGFQNQYSNLFNPIATSDDPNAAFGEFSSFIPGMIDFMGAFGGYNDWNSSVVSDLQGLRDVLVDREETLNLRLEVVITQDGRSVASVVTDAVVANTGGITNVMAERIGNILNLRMNR